MLAPRLAFFLDLVNFAVCFADETIKALLEVFDGDAFEGCSQSLRSAPLKFDGSLPIPVGQGLLIPGQGVRIGEAGHSRRLLLRLTLRILRSLLIYVNISVGILLEQTVSYDLHHMKRVGSYVQMYSYRMAKAHAFWHALPPVPRRPTVGL